MLNVVQFQSGEGGSQVLNIKHLQINPSCLQQSTDRFFGWKLFYAGLFLFSSLASLSFNISPLIQIYKLAMTG